MKIKILVLLLIFASPVLGQESKAYLKLKKKYNNWEGYIIKWDSTKLEGLVKDYITNTIRYHSSVNFIHKDGTKVNYEPYYIKAFSFLDYTYESDSFSFYELLVRGTKTSLYRIVTRSSSLMPGPPGMGSISHATYKNNYYLKRPSERHFKSIKKEDFKKESLEYFKDCALIVEEIKNGKYTYDDFETIVEKYNECK